MERLQQNCVQSVFCSFLFSMNVLTINKRAAKQILKAEKQWDPIGNDGEANKQKPSAWWDGK